MLMELIAEHGIVEEIGEVVEEIELTLDGVSIRLPIARVIGPGDARRERKTIGVAAIARVFRAIESDQRDRTLRDLVNAEDLRPIVILQSDGDEIGALKDAEDRWRSFDAIERNDHKGMDCLLSRV